MSVLSDCRRKALADMWCRQCSHASRLGQWVPTADHCPYCGVPSSQRLPWVWMRLYHPALPLCPVTGAEYRLGSRK